MRSLSSPNPTSRPAPRPTRLALALLAAGLQHGIATAQQAVPPPAPEATAAPSGDSLRLDSVVVTGSPTRLSKMKQSASVSTLDSDQIERTGAQSAAELLRSIPGVRSESSGGEGNANITVRGVPISAGGARYVQLQEDGLPLLLFGDIAFGTSDQFLRADVNVDRLEVVRGGSASTLASNSPGGLVNFISKTGAEPGGSVGFSLAHPREFRVDADYGAAIGPATSFHIGGFGRVGKDGRPADFDSAKGGQVRANLTQKFDAGYLRVYLKALDDKTPTFLPVPVKTVNGRIDAIPNIDPRRAFLIGSNLTQDTVLTRDGSFTTVNPHDGLHVKSTSIGLEGSFDVGAGFTVEDRLRKSWNSGRFIGMFPSDNGSNGTASTFTGVLFDTSLDNFDNLFNELKVSKALQLGGGKMTLSGGLFSGDQKVAETWYWNRYNLQMTGSNPQAVDAAGNPTTTPAGSGFTTFGGCCVRNWSVKYTQLAPFASVAYEVAGLNLDASLRHDNEKASGYAVLGSATVRGFDRTTLQKVDYSVSHTSYSLGANYLLTKDLAFFGRASDGVSFSADRLLFGNPLDGSVPISVNKVTQVEAGAKWRSGAASVFATLFNARTNESNYEVTTQKTTANKYDAYGLELEAAWSYGGFRISGGTTYTKAKIKESNDPTTVGMKPRRQADWVFQLAPSYGFGDLDIGAQIVGTGKSYGDDQNTITMPGFAVVNPFVSYRINPKLSVLVAANNVFDKLGYTEVEGDGHAARAVNGRTYRASVKLDF